MKRLVTVFFMAIFAMFTSLSGAQAQSKTGWNLNINADKPSPVTAGAEIEFTAIVNNSDNFPTIPTSVSFTLPKTVKFLGFDVDADIFSACSPVLPIGQELTDDTTITCEVRALAPQESVTAKIRLSPMVAGVIPFNGKIAENGAQQSRTITVNKGADLAVSLQTPGKVKGGGKVEFSATVTNNGPYPSTGSTLTFPVPAGIVLNQPMTNGCTLSGNAVTCKIDQEIQNGGSLKFDFSGQVTVGNNSNIVIDAKVIGNSPLDPNVENNGEIANVIVTAGIDLSLSKVRSPQGLILTGSPVEFNLTPQFAGDEPSTATIKDTLPDNYEFVGFGELAGTGWACILTGREVTCEYSKSNTSQYKTPIKINTTAVASTHDGKGSGASVYNYATITSEDEDKDYGENNTANDGGASIVDPYFDLEASKSGGPDYGLVVVGEEYQYRLQSKNIGNSGFDGKLTITDHLPEHMTVTAVDVPTGWSCSALPMTGPGNFVCETDQYTPENQLATGSTAGPVILTVKMEQSGKFTNRMTVSGPEGAEKSDLLGNNTDSIGGNAGSEKEETLADLEIIKTRLTPETVKAGDPLKFKLEVINRGKAVATGVVIDDTLKNIVGSSLGGKATITVVPSSNDIICTQPSSGATEVQLKCTIASLPVFVAGEPYPSIEISTFAGNEGTQTNTAVVYSTETPDGNLSNNQSSVNYTVEPVTDVTVIKSSSSENTGSPAGQGIVYTIAARVEDNGLSGAADVVIEDKLPEGVRFVSITANGASCTTSLKEDDVVTSTNNTISCTWARLENGTQREVAIEVKPSTEQVGQTLINNATIKTKTEETNTNNNSDSASVLVLEPVLDLLVTKTDTVDGVQHDPVEKGLNTTYLITAKNDGPSDAYNVKIVDTFPAAGFTFDKVEGASTGLICAPSGVTAGQSGGTLTCSVPVLKAGSEVQFKVHMESLVRGTHENKVEVISDETVKGYDRNPTNNFDNETTTVRVKSDVSVVKTADKKVVDLRESFTWTLTVESHVGVGLEVAENVILKDTLPEGMVLTAVPAITTGAGSCAGSVGTREISCKLGDMEPGEKTIIQLTTKIVDQNAEAMTNAASVTTDSFDQNPNNNTSTDSVTTVRGGSVSGTIFKDFNEDTTQNTGDAGLAGVTVTLTGKAKHDGEDITMTIPTKADGSYDFTGVPPGEYQVSYSNVPDSSKYKTGVAVPGDNGNGSSSKSVNNTTLGSITIEEDKSSVNNNFTLIPVPSVGLSKVASAPVSVGDGTYTVEYKFTIKNLSQEPLKDIALTDALNGASQNFGELSADAKPLPGTYKVQSVSTNTGYNGSDNNSLISNEKLEPNATLAATIVVLVNPAKPWKSNPLVLTNQAEVTAVGEYSGKTGITDKSDNRAGGEDHPDWNTPTTVNIVPEAAIQLEKTGARVGGTGEITAGDVIEYTFKVTNTGKTPLFDVVITDPMADLKWTINNTITELAVGASNDTAFKATYVVKQTDIDNGTLENTAEAEGTWGDFGGTPQKVSTTDDFDLALSEPALTFEKKLKQSDVQNPSVVGDKITYEFIVTNTGNTTLKNVVVTDELADVVDSGAFNIGTLAPQEVKTVEAYYLIKLEDINAGKVINNALASGTYGPNDERITTPPSEVEVPTYRDPKLKLVKALSSTVPEPAYAGDMLEWTVTATNEGNVTLTNVTVTDPLVDAVITPSSIASLAPGESGTFTVAAPIQQEHLNDGQVDNIATVNFEDPTGPKPPVDSNEVETPLVHKPSISLDKAAILDGLSTPAKIGDEVVYSFTIRNTGNVALNGLVLTDHLDDVVIDAADAERLKTLTLQPVNAAKDNEAEVQTVVYGRYQLKVADINAGKVENTADVQGIPVFGDKTPVTDDSTTETPLDRNPSIKLVKTIEAASLKQPVKAGDVIQFNFAIHNTGNVTLENIRIEDAIADEVINQSGWTGPLEPGEVNEDAFIATYALKQSDIDAGTFANTAHVYGSSVNGTPDDVTDISGTDLTNDDETVVDLETSAAVTIVKSETHAFSSPTKVGEVITYSFLVTNTGNLTLSNVVVEDPLTGLEPDMSFTIATLLPGDENAVTLTATYKVTQADIEKGEVVNQATVTGDYVDPKDKTTKPVTPDVSEEIIVPLEQKPGIAVVKEANSKLTEPAEVGQEIEYTFTVHNTGNMVLNNVVLSDPLQGITPNSFTIGTMEPGEEQSFTATYAITEADIDAEQVINQATVKGTYGDPTSPKDIEDPSGPTIDTDEPTIVPVMPPLPELKIIKQGEWNDANGNGYPEVGETLEFTFKVTNEGNALLNNVTVQDEGPLFAGNRGTNQLSAITPAPVSLNPGESQTFKATYVLSQADIDATAGIPETLTNTAFAKGDQRNGKPYESEEDKAKITLPATEPSLVKITKQALLHQVRRGDRVPYIIKVENTSSSNAGPVNVIDTMPSGFRYVEATAIVNGEKTEPEINGRRLQFKNLKLTANSTIEIRLELLVLSSAGPGKHANIATVTDRDGNPVAPDAHAIVEIMAEPVFDCGEIIGTVFDDKNRNGYQDEGEKGLAGVRVATVKGWLITTDEYGRFHVPCAALPDQRIGSNFIMKLDTRTLPTGYRLTTENPRVVRLTAGKMTKLNFGASISRVVRLDLQDAAFEANRVELKKQWADNLPQLMEILKQEISVLRLSYKMAGNEQSLAKERMKHVRKQIGDLWKRKGDNYPLEIETRVEVSK
ncbi:SdrD B-like domain-containing protein [Brucellaceae bacterium C25G]